MKNAIYIIFLISVINCIAKEDTLKVELKQVEVKADRLLSNDVIKYNAFSIIDNSVIESINPWELSEVIGISSGVHINEYGGLGGLKTVSLRGTKSNQNIIMIDGIKMNSSQNGIADLSTISSMMYDRIEIVKGGNSSVYGGSAIGGIINISNSGFSDKLMSINYSAGSFNSHKIKANINSNLFSVKNSTGFNFESSDGNYPFSFPELDEEFERLNSKYYSYSISNISQFDLSGWDTKIRIYLNHFQRGIPGPFITISSLVENESNLEEDSGYLILSTEKNLTESSSISFAANMNSKKSQYQDNLLLGVNGLFEADFVNNDIGLVGRYKFVEQEYIFNIGIESYYSTLTSDNINFAYGDFVDRLNSALYVNAEKKYDWEDIALLNLFAGIRGDYYTDVDNSLSGNLGLIAGSNKYPISMKSNVSYNFRAPSFNELYYLNFGNVDLLPEKSLSYSIGFNYDFQNVKISFDGFLIHTSNQIVAVPSSPISWSAQNIEEVFSKGYEINFQGEFFEKKLYVSLAYTLQDIKNVSDENSNKDNYIVYSPPELLSLFLKYSVFDFDVGSVLKYSNFYYSLADNSFDSMLPKYALIDLFTSYDLKIFNNEFTFRFEVKNILNKQYQIIKNYPMPGRNFRLNLIIKR